MNFAYHRVWKKGRYVVSLQQKQEIAELLNPGDVLIEKREWHLSNLGIPGFWQHVAFSIGTPETRHLLSQDPSVMEWVKTQKVSAETFEDLLRLTYPIHYQKYITSQKRERLVIIEALSPRVTLTSVNHTANVDSIAILRPLTTPLTIAIAIFRAFAFIDRPYDFNFDFSVDSAMVCSEVVTKAFEPSETTLGIPFPYTPILGRLMVVPNTIVRQFETDYRAGTPIFELVLFLDGDLKQKRAMVSDLEHFLESWKSPKWHVLKGN